MIPANKRSATLPGFLDYTFLFVFLCSVDAALCPSVQAEEDSLSRYRQRVPYAAETFVPPPPLKSTLRLADNGDGTITDPDTQLMWTKKDSYADLSRCMRWHEGKAYVENLTTGGYDDWRLPTQRELYSIYDFPKNNVMGWDHDPENPLHMDEKFADGAAYWYWTSKFYDTELTECCAVSFYFVQGTFHARRYTMCMNGGVRGVRRIK